MREFILRARKAKTNPDIKLDSLPQQGKLDVVCSTVASALFLSGDVRRDTNIHVVLEGPNLGPKTISFYGASIKGLRHDEHSIAQYIANSLQKGAYLNLNEEINVRTGIRVAKKSFERLLWERSKHTQAIILDKTGKDIRSFQFKPDTLFVLGSAEGLPGKTLQSIKDKISLGPKDLFAAHCPTIIHNELDRR